MKQLSLLSVDPPKSDVATAPRSTSAIGARAELAVAGALCKAGFAVFTPFFNAHGRIDVLYESERTGVRRVQCKSAHYKNDVVMFYTRSHTGGIERGYAGDVDEFGVYSEHTGLVYLVPVELVTARLTYLRAAPTRNSQQRGVRWAKDYVLGPPW